jgi:6-pyruvoyltetrahydropterin/6-carboxytetrahydropterin synthase
MNERVYSTGTATGVRASHVMPGMPPPEGEPHEHDYRLEAVVSREKLDERGMVVDLDLLDGALADVVALLDGADLDQVVAPEMAVEAVTVEVFARWLHGRVAASLGAVPGAALSVRVWESPVAFGGYAGPLDDASTSS